MPISNLTNNKIKNKLKVMGIAATVAISIGYAEAAKALTISTSGVWNGTTGSPFELQGENTNQISWGKSTGSGKSSYVFDGVNNLSLNLDGSNFLVGTFTHNNFPITNGSIKGANLSLNMNLGTTGSQTFNLFFNHNETVNGGLEDKKRKGEWYRKCDVVGWMKGQPLCPDVVSLPSLTSKEQVNINGDQYQLVVSGFYQDNKLTTQFITQENKVNTAQLYARLQKVAKARVPEPASVLGLLAIGAVGSVSLKHKHKQSAENN
jgi:hypothetical protein